MDGLFWLSGRQLERTRPFFPRSRGVSPVDDGKVVSGIIYMLRNGGSAHCSSPGWPAPTAPNRKRRCCY
ncbi:MAG: hypothetical protein OXF67_05415 [Cyanobacteria bacterium MAG CAR4_bin_6]|nr:hypothetical protein [Cyanobacteria bacterium MAG CAR4_bin_6]